MILVQIIAFHIPVVAINMILGMILFVASDQQRKWVLVGCTAAVLNPILNLFAIPFTRDHFDNGAIGAAITTVATEMVMMFGGFYLRPTGVLDRWTVGMCCTVRVGATVPMVVVVLALGDLPLPVKIVVGVVVYAASTRTVPPASRSNLGELTDQVFESIKARGQHRIPAPHRRVNEMSTPSPAQNAVHVSAVICTRNRPDKIGSGGRQRTCKLTTPTSSSR